MRLEFLDIEELGLIRECLLWITTSAKAVIDCASGNGISGYLFGSLATISRLIDLDRHKERLRLVLVLQSWRAVPVQKSDSNVDPESVKNQTASRDVPSETVPNTKWWDDASSFASGGVDDLIDDDDMDLEELGNALSQAGSFASGSSKQNVKKEVESSQKTQYQVSRPIEAEFSKNRVNMMKVCKAQGFVYGIIPEKGKPVTGASDNLREWWKEKIRFDRNSPAIQQKLPLPHLDIQHKFMRKWWTIPICVVVALFITY